MDQPQKEDKFVRRADLNEPCHGTVHSIDSMSGKTILFHVWCDEEDENLFHYSLGTEHNVYYDILSQIRTTTRDRTTEFRHSRSFSPTSWTTTSANKYREFKELRLAYEIHMELKLEAHDS